MSFTPKQRVLMRESRGRAHVYTVLFPDPFTPIGIREDQARSLRVGIAYKDGKVRNDFDRIPIFQRPIFNATWSVKKRQWEDFVPYGASGFTWSPTEAMREVVYRCYPFWYQLDMSGEYGPYRVSVSDRPLEGFTLAPMFRTGKVPVHRPVFEMTIDENRIPHSRAGAMPYISNPDDLMDMAWRFDETAARLESVRDWFSDALLQLVEFARWDVGTVMPGNRSDTITKTGEGIIGTEASLSDRGNGYGCVWRGKENPWKNVNSYLCDLLGKKQVVDDGSTRVMLYYLKDAFYYDGDLNEYYKEVGSYVSRDMGHVEVGGWQLSSVGIMYPSKEIAKGIVAKAMACLACESNREYAIHVGVGGGCGNILLPSTVPSSPFHWEAVQRSCDGYEHFGGRLVLEEE